MVEIIDSDSKLLLQTITIQIFRIVKNEDFTHTIIIKEYVPEDDIKWYCVYNYLYPYHGI